MPKSKKSRPEVDEFFLEPATREAHVRIFNSGAVFNPRVRVFDSGATRDSEDGKFDYEGFLSPIVIRRYAEYMHQHRTQPDGKMRDSDNWQRKFGLPVLMKSGFRHFVDWWLIHRGHKAVDRKTGEAIDIQDALCALIFNASAYLYEILEASPSGE